MALEAGMVWNDARFYSMAEDIAQGVTLGACQALEALEKWPRSRALETAQILLSDGESCYAGLGLSGLEMYQDLLAENLSRSAEWSYEAGATYKDDLFETYEKQIVAGVAQSKIFAFQAGKKWEKERFKRNAAVLGPKIVSDRKLFFRALREWSPGNFNALAREAVQALPNELQKGYSGLRSCDHRFWWQLWERTGEATMARLNPAQFTFIADVYRQAPKRIKNDLRKGFYFFLDGSVLEKSLHEALQEKKLLPWIEQEKALIEKYYAIKPSYRKSFLATAHFVQNLDQLVKITEDDLYVMMDIKNNLPSQYTAINIEVKLSLQQGHLTSRLSRLKGIRNIDTLLPLIPASYHSTWHEFASKIGIISLMEISSADFLAAARAYDFSRQSGQELQFWEGLQESAQKGTIGAWSQCIVDYFRKDAKGGGNYRLMEGTA